jgi:drug/metabolite transporter (DMT)-like permease
MTSVGFALAASVLLGAGDGVAALLVRKYSVAGVAIVTQLAGASTILLIAALGDIDGAAVTYGLAAGVLQGVTVVVYYRALADGMVTVMAPILAMSAVVTFALALGRGEEPHPVSVIGASAAILGIVLAAIPEHSLGGVRRAALGFAAIGAVAQGVYIFVLGVGSANGYGMSLLLGIRIGGLVTVISGVALLVERVHMNFRLAWLGSLYGVISGSALALLSRAFESGLISLVAVVAATTPLVTILFGRIILNESLTRFHVIGLSLALAGVVLVSVAQ